MEEEKTFTITKEHLKLLQNMYVWWYDCEYGAPTIDPKRPYGNSNVEADILEILGYKKIEANYEETYLTKDLEYAAKLHKEMETVLQICLCTLSFKEGTYRKKYSYMSRSWYLVEDNPPSGEEGVR